MSEPYLIDPRPPDPLRAAREKMAQRLAEAMYGGGPDERVRLLRESVLGPQPHEGTGVSGLAAWLPTPPPPGV